jgi:phosphatidylethanolamine/phosphatidyl-N-methylethanolamine N-methyltransferase
MNEHLKFLQSFLKKPATVGAVAPSSPDLAKKMIEGVFPDKDNAVLEIGCGTGAITKFIKGLIPDRESFLGIEIEKDFVERLNGDYPELNILCDDARHAGTLLKRENIGKVSYIISGLPFVVLPKEMSDGILEEVDKLMAHGCLFRTFQYAHGYHLPPAVRFRESLNKKYGEVKVSNMILKNVPPAYTLSWQS